jgi:hypothetical protein
VIHGSVENSSQLYIHEAWKTRAPISVQKAVREGFLEEVVLDCVVKVEKVLTR